jgi:hypothetical protein
MEVPIGTTGTSSSRMTHPEVPKECAGSVDVQSLRMLGPTGTWRSPATTWLLFIVTLSLYDIYWWGSR